MPKPVWKPPPPSQRRKVTWGTCPKCRGWVGRALDADVLAFSAVVAAFPLSEFGEAQVLKLTMHCWTYEVENRRLYRRDQYSRSARPAGPDNLVIPDHICWVNFPESWRQIERTPRIKPYVVPDDPPF